MMRANRFNMLSGLILVVMAQPIIAADDVPKIIRVEEDWELIVNTPDPYRDSPQVSTWMSPAKSLNGEYFGVDINYVQRVGYVGGGIQTKRMKGKKEIESHYLNMGSKLRFKGETIKWTQMLAVIEQDLVFAVKDGKSTSWGDFGGPDTLILVPFSSGNLNNYDVNLTCESSGVGYALNRVASLKLLRVRFYTDEQISEIVLDRAID